MRKNSNNQQQKEKIKINSRALDIKLLFLE